MDILSLIQSARSSEDVNRLLQAMGQTGQPAAPTARAPMDPLMQQSSAIGQLLIDNPMSMAQVQATLGSAARPQVPSAAANVAASAPAALDPYEQILRRIAAESLDARAGAIVAATQPVAQEKSLGKAAGADEPLPDPRDVSKAGNVEGGAERVNARTAEHGVRAIKGPDGKITLTNIGEDGQPTKQSQPQGPMFGSSVKGRITELLDQVRNSKDSTEAQGLSDSLRNSIIEEKMRIEKEARDFAEAEVKLPALRRALTAQQALDNTAPGMPASAASIRIQQQIKAAETIAADRSKDWLVRNLPYQQLKTTELNAEQAITIAVQKQAAQEDRINLKDQAALIAKEKKEEEAKTQFEMLSPAQHQLILELNPNLRAAGKEAEAVGYVKQQMKISKEFAALIAAADDAEQKNLAFAGNKLARQVFAQREAQITGRSVESVERELEDITNIPLTDNELKTYAKSAGATTPEAQKNFMAQFKSLSGPGATKEQMKEGEELKSRIRQGLLQQHRTNKFLTDVLSWAPSGSALELAAKKTMEIKGQADINSVINLLIKDKTAAEQMTILTQVREQMVSGARKYDSSPIAKADVGTLVAQYNQAVVEDVAFSQALRNPALWAPESIREIGKVADIVGGWFK